MRNIRQDGSNHDFMIALKKMTRIIKDCEKLAQKITLNKIQPLIVDSKSVVFTNENDWELHLDFINYDWAGFVFNNNRGIFTEYWNGDNKHRKIFSTGKFMLIVQDGVGTLNYPSKNITKVKYLADYYLDLSARDVLCQYLHQFV